jgi:hypothetical protein
VVSASEARSFACQTEFGQSNYVSSALLEEEGLAASLASEEAAEVYGPS